MGLNETTTTEFYYLDVPSGMTINEASRGALALAVAWNKPISFLFSGKVIEVHNYKDSPKTIVEQWNRKMYGS